MTNSLEPVLEKVGRVLSEEYGIRVQCRGNRCCTDGKRIFLPALPDEIPDDLFQAIRGFLDHESGHVAGKSDFRVGAEFKAKHGSEAFGLLNCLEDLRIESFMARRYPGSAVNLSNAYRYAAKAATEKHEAGETLPPMKQLAFAIHSRANGLPDLPFVEPPIRAAADSINQEIQQSVTAPDTKTIARLAESAWSTVESLLRALPQPKEPGGASQPEGADESGVPGNSASSAAGNAKPQPKRRRRNPNSQSGDGDTSAASSPSSASTDPTAASGMGTDDDVGVIGSLGQDIAASVSRYATTHQQYRAWSTELDTVTVPPDTSPISHAERMAPLMRHVSGVRQKLLQSLMAESRVRWLPDQPEGRLNPRALHRLAAAGWLAKSDSAASPEQASALTRNVFRRKVVAKRLKTAVTLLIDASHSMSTRKLDLAKAAALVLCESLARLNIPVSVIAFSTEHHGKLLRETAQATGIPADQLEKQFRFAPLVHEILQRFGESFQKISGRFDQLRTHLMTPLGESVLFAARDLAKRPEPRKVLLVLTDGRPTVGMDNDAITFRHDKPRRKQRSASTAVAASSPTEPVASEPQSVNTIPLPTTAGSMEAASGATTALLSAMTAPALKPRPFPAEHVLPVFVPPVRQATGSRAIPAGNADAAAVAVAAPTADTQPKKRNRPIHEWPPIGTRLVGEYFGVTYHAEIVEARKKLKSGKQIRLVDGPAQGKRLDSFSKAALVATARQRRTSKLGRKGMSSGWIFWSILPPPAS